MREGSRLRALRKGDAALASSEADELHRVLVHGAGLMVTGAAESSTGISGAGEQWLQARRGASIRGGLLGCLLTRPPGSTLSLTAGQQELQLGRLSPSHS